MPTDSKSDHPPQKGSKKTDDLTAIKGIGKALEQWFRESFKVQTFADLGALSAEEVETRAKQDGRALSFSNIEQILAQARERAAVSQASPTQSDPPEAGSTGTPISNASIEENDWKEFATFIINFERKLVAGKEEKQTAISHHETDGKAGPWPGVEVDKACNWMLARLSEKEESVMTKEGGAPKVQVPSPAQLPIPEPISIEITGIQVFQPPSTDQPQELFKQNHEFTGMVRSGNPLSFAVTFQLSGDAAAEAARNHKEFIVVFDAVDLFSSALTPLGVSRPDYLKEGQFSYTARLAPLTITTGVYQLNIAATLRNGQPISGKADVPLLQVV